MENDFCLNHPDRPVRSRGLCGSCYNKFLYDSNPILKENMMKRRRELSKLKPHNPEENRARQLKHRYGITIEEYDKMLISQNNGCAICGKETAYNSGEKRLHVDHCHITGKVRGLLCSQCNTTLGHLESLGIKNFIEYMEKK